MDPAEVVLRFLESIGHRSDAEFYLSLFRAEPKERFAAISVDASTARYARDAVVLDLRFLRALGLIPTVILGLFDTPTALPDTSAQYGARLVEELAREAISATLIASRPPSELAEAAAQAITQGTVPILIFNQQPLEAKGQDLATLLHTLQTRKLIFLHRRGGFRQNGTLVPLCNLTTDFAALIGSRDLSRQQQMILRLSKRLIFDWVPHKLMIAVASPLELLRELFTVRGAGTLLRRGAAIERYLGLEQIDCARLAQLLESSFGRPPAEGFFSRPMSQIYLEADYHGAALLDDTPLGAYLSKFAVDREAQGEGMGRDLWERLTADNPVVFWRARPANPISAWYTKLCDGLARFAEWQVFWKGLPSATIPSAIDYALSQPIDIPRLATG